MWIRLVNAALGVWLMAAPAVFDYGTPAATSDRIAGPLIAAAAIVAIWETTRPLRRLNTVLGVWLLAAPLLLGFGGAAMTNSIAVGVVVIGLSLMPGPMEKRFGGGWTALWRPPKWNAPSDEPTEYADTPADFDEPTTRPRNLPAQSTSYERSFDMSESYERPEVVVITGASAGVGRATAAAFARQGAHIGLLARGVERLEAARREVEDLGGKALVLPVDVAHADQVEAAATVVEETFGPIDIWVNNAMVSVFSPVKEMQAEEFRRVTEVTYLGYVYGTLSALKRMLPRNRGVIVQVGSALAYRGIPLQAAYCGAKHAIEGFSDSLRTELLHDESDVKVTMVQMPALNTPQFSWVKSRLPNKAQPVPPIFEPEVAANAIVWAARNPRREVIVGGSSLKAILAEKFVPGLAGRYLARSGYKSQQTDEPRDPDRLHNLWEPVPGDQRGAHGAFTDRARSSSFQFWIARHVKALSAAVAGFAAVVTSALIARSRG